MKIINAAISATELKEKHSNFFDSMIKAVVDIEKEIIAVDAELHADLEEILIQQGSKQENLWGFNIYPDKKEEEIIEYTSLINIRPHQGNKGMEIKNEDIRSKIKNISKQLIQI